MNLDSTCNHLRAEVNDRIALGHLHIVLASDANFPCDKSGDGVGLAHNFAIPLQLWHESELGCWNDRIESFNLNKNLIIFTHLA